MGDKSCRCSPMRKKENMNGVTNRSTSPIFARSNSILLFYSSLLILLSGSSEALANSFHSYSHSHKTVKGNSLSFHNHVILSASHKFHNRNDGWISRARLPLSLSIRGGSLSPFATGLNDSDIHSDGDFNGSNGKEQINDDSIQRPQRNQLGSNRNLNINDNNEMNSIVFSSLEVNPNKHYPCSYVAECDLPTDIGSFRLRAYRITDNLGEAGGGLQRNKWLGTEPCVIYSKDKPLSGANGKNVPIRIHDQCFTSEVFRSKRCDCKEQLNMALQYIKENGGGIIYLQQEGRGIGLANKVAAYALQDVGLDTVDANTHLGLPEDCRQYGVVPSILHDLGIQSIKLMTNNPRKIDRLTALGIDVPGTIPMVVARPNPYNRKYLQTKKDRMNHLNFANLLSMENAEISPYSKTATDSASTNAVVNKAMNGMMKPRKRPVQESAAAAVTSAISNSTDISSLASTESAAAAVTAVVTAAVIDSTKFSQQEDTESSQMAGVSAAADGYCIGRQSVEDAIEAVARGDIVVVVDDMDRENEGDFIMAADLATPEAIATIVKYSSGVICVGMEGKTMDRLELPAMLVNNEDPKGTAFSVTVDAAPEHGITTGISAKERALTIRMLAKDSTQPIDLRRPGHIFPLRAREGGVLTRDGHTEAAVDLARLAGCHPSGVLCEIVSEEHPTEMARLPELARMCTKRGWVMTSIVDIAQYRKDTENLK